MSLSHLFSSYFSVDSTANTRLFYLISLLLTVIYGFVALLAPLVTPECDIAPEQPRPARRALVQGLEGGLEDAPNPSYEPDPCRWIRYVALLGMNKWEADMSRRIVLSILMGSLIGFERRRADRPAGIRTMAMVSLGACVFTLGSMYAFVDGTMGWDASRVSAAIPSGVGFLGAASIWKGTKGSGASAAPEVHGLTTATSVWLSAAIGILCGGGLYVPSLFATLVGIVYLRFAPRLTRGDEGSLEDEEAPSSPLREPLNPGGRPDAGSAPVPVTPSVSRRDSSDHRSGSAKILAGGPKAQIHA